MQQRHGDILLLVQVRHIVAQAADQPVVRLVLAGSLGQIGVARAFRHQFGIDHGLAVVSHRTVRLGPGQQACRIAAQQRVRLLDLSLQLLEHLPGFCHFADRRPAVGQAPNGVRLIVAELWRCVMQGLAGFVHLSRGEQQLDLGESCRGVFRIDAQRACQIGLCCGWLAALHRPVGQQQEVVHRVSMAAQALLHQIGRRGFSPRRAQLGYTRHEFAPLDTRRKRADVIVPVARGDLLQAGQGLGVAFGRGEIERMCIACGRISGLAREQVIEGAVRLVEGALRT